jgi:DNA-binding GntR family transcriptional regulator
MHLMRGQSFRAPDGGNPSRAEHQAIVDALASREPETAARCLREHVENGFRRILNVQPHWTAG